MSRGVGTTEAYLSWAFTRSGRLGSADHEASSAPGVHELALVGRAALTLRDRTRRPGQPIQIIDVTDLASWIVDAGENGLTGTYDATGPLGEATRMIEDIAAAVGFDGEMVKVPSKRLEGLGVNGWGGPKSLPLWLPSHEGLKSHDPAPSIAAGMPVRPFADTVADALARERELGLDRDRKAGLSLDEEKEVLAKV